MHGIFSTFNRLRPSGGFIYICKCCHKTKQETFFVCVKQRSWRLTHELKTPTGFWFQSQKHSGGVLRSIMILATKKVEKLPEVKPNPLLCPFQVSGSEGRNSTSSKGWRWRESAASGSRELTSPPACPGLITPTSPRKQQYSGSSSSRLNNKLTSRIQVNRREEGGWSDSNRPSAPRWQSAPPDSGTVSFHRSDRQDWKVQEPLDDGRELEFPMLAQTHYLLVIRWMCQPAQTPEIGFVWFIFIDSYTIYWSSIFILCRWFILNQTSKTNDDSSCYTSEMKSCGAFLDCPPWPFSALSGHLKSRRLNFIF